VSSGAAQVRDHDAERHVVVRTRVVRTASVSKPSRNRYVMCQQASTVRRVREHRHGAMARAQCRHGLVEPDQSLLSFIGTGTCAEYLPTMWSA